MSRNGSGTYSAPSNSWNPAVTGVTATVSDWQALLDDMVAALTQSVSKDGQTTMTNSLPMGGNKLTGLGAPAGTGQSLRWEQMIKGDDIASADSISIPTEGSCFDVTGTTTITAIADTFIGKTACLRFTDSLTITHSASLVLPGGADITTQEGDVAIFVNIAAGIWRCVTCAPITTQTIVGSDVSTPLNVVSYGNNANGYWVRFAGGLQICWFSNYLFYANVNDMTATITFPVEFAGDVVVPIIVPTATWNIENRNYGMVPRLNSATVDGMSVSAYNPSGTNAPGDQLLISWVVFGVWQ